MTATVALAQITGRPGDLEANGKMIEAAVADSLGAGADLVVLPELIAGGYTADREILEATAEQIDGPLIDSWVRLAAVHGGYIAGGFCERADGHLFNSTALVGPEGLVLHYRKLHPFDQEKLVFEPGDLGLPVADLPFGRVGMCVCYDLRFVEVVRALSLQGADLICVPTAWLAGFDRVKWDERGLAPQANGAILQANLDQVFIACASQAGTEDGPEFLGSSIVVGPRGELILGPMPGTSEGIEAVEVDLADAVRARTRAELITPREDRRTDVYGVKVGEEIL